MPYSITKIYDQRLLSSFSGSAWNSKNLYGPVRSGVKTGSRVLNHKQLIKESREASSNYVIEAFTYKEITPSTVKGSCTNLQPGGTTRTMNYSGFPGNNQSFLALPSFDDNRAISKLHQKLRENRSQMNGYLFLGELAETLKMLRSPADALVKGFFTWSNDIGRRLAKNPSLRHARNRRNLVDTLSGTWLEASYGWSPFISDVGEIARTVGRIVVDREQLLDRISATSVNQGTPTLQVFDIKGPPPYTTGFPLPIHTWERRMQSEAEVRYVIFLKGECKGPLDSFEKVAQVTGFTFENVVPTIYNLIPYSFLLDYVSNLGECLEAQFTDVSRYSFGVVTRRGTQSVKVISTPNVKAMLADMFAEGYKDLRSASGTPGCVEEIRTTLNRSRLTSFPTPTLEFNLTSSWKKATNVLALLSGSLKGHRL